MSQKIFIIKYPRKDKDLEKYDINTEVFVNAIKENINVECQTIEYLPNKQEELKQFLLENAKCIISRVILKDLSNVDEYLDFLKFFADNGVNISTHPDTIVNLDSKNILVALKETPLGEESTYFYDSFEHFAQRFPIILRDEKVRILKTNYGSSGEGIYLVKFNDDQTVECTMALRNEKITYPSIYDFLKFFEDKFGNGGTQKYFKNKKGLVGCKYLPEISKGEIRVLLTKDRVVSIVEKIPLKGNFSANLSSGATYIYHDPLEEKWRDIIEFTLDGLDYLEKYCVNDEFPLIWSMDYIIDINNKKLTTYLLSEINSSYVVIPSEDKYIKKIIQAIPCK